MNRIRFLFASLLLSTACSAQTGRSVASGAAPKTSRTASEENGTSRTLVCTVTPPDRNATLYRIHKETIRETDPDSHFTIEVDQLSVDGLDDTVAIRVNSLLDMTAGIRKFKQHVESDYKEWARSLGKSLKCDPPGWDYTRKADVLTSSSRLISVRIYEWGHTGGVHGYSTTAVVNFDLSSGKSLELGDLFLSDADCLQRIAARCVDVLEKRFAANGIVFFREGAEPTAHNYRRWGIRNDCLVVFFDPYDVNCWADGPQEVDTPLRDLGDIIAPDGPVGEFAR
ncbi:DUF3298 domain-containing protein [Candidatus Sumerlaeota bacterium]|nr:DUF3298 domain-containing protein [Candidatus Sumerlaeota bacterium]